MTFEYFQGESLHNLFWQPVQVLSHPQSKWGWTIFLNSNFHRINVSWIFLLFQITSKKCNHLRHSQTLCSFYLQPFLLIANIAFHYLTFLSKVSLVLHPDNSKRSLIGFPNPKGTIFKYHSITIMSLTEASLSILQMEKDCRSYKKMFKIICKTYKVYIAVD